MAVILRNVAAPGLAVTYQGLGMPLNIQPATGVAEQTVGPTFGWETYFKHISCSGT